MALLRWGLLSAFLSILIWHFLFNRLSLTKFIRYRSIFWLQPRQACFGFAKRLDRAWSLLHGISGYWRCNSQFFRLGCPLTQLPGFRHQHFSGIVKVRPAFRFSFNSYLTFSFQQVELDQIQPISFPFSDFSLGRPASASQNGWIALEVCFMVFVDIGAVMDIFETWLSIQTPPRQQCLILLMTKTSLTPIRHQQRLEEIRYIFSSPFFHFAVLFDSNRQLLFLYSVPFFFLWWLFLSMTRTTMKPRALLQACSGSSSTFLTLNFVLHHTPLLTCSFLPPFPIFLLSLLIASPQNLWGRVQHRTLFHVRFVYRQVLKKTANSDNVFLDVRLKLILAGLPSSSTSSAIFALLMTHPYLPHAPSRFISWSTRSTTNLSAPRISHPHDFTHCNSTPLFSSDSWDKTLMAFLVFVRVARHPEIKVVGFSCVPNAWTHALCSKTSTNLI